MKREKLPSNINIGIFKPLVFTNENLDIEQLNKVTGKTWTYASSGKSGLFHCLKSLNVKGVVMLPVYVCDSVLKPIKMLQLDTCYYDIDLKDFNVDITDFKKKLKLHNVSCVVVASMYGNPASLIEVEKICTEENILLIDDAAQSFGAKLESRYVGTFGDAGFFSFSPGKPTAGHLGAFFWTKNDDYVINRTSHKILHFIAFIDFYFNRYKTFRYRKIIPFYLLKYVKGFLFKYINVTNDEICNFERPILGGILKTNENTIIRKTYLLEFINGVQGIKTFEIITKAEKLANNHKIILLIDTVYHAKYYVSNLCSYGVYTSKGYPLLSNLNVPNAVSIADRIIEIPLEINSKKIQNLIRVIKQIDSRLYKEYHNH